MEYCRLSKFWAISFWNPLISAQIVLFCTLFIGGFEHFLCTNQLNLPDLHIKVPAILLITFCGYFCSFCKLNSPKLLSQLKHEESELNSVLQIRNQRKEEQKTEEIGLLQNFAGLRKVS